VLVASGDLQCLTPAGEDIWHMGVSGPVMVALAHLQGQGLDVVAGGTRTEAFGPEGQPLWSTDTPEVYSLATGPAEGGPYDDVLVAGEQGWASLLDPQGNEKWRAKLRGTRSNGAFLKNPQGVWQAAIGQQIDLYRLDLEGNEVWHASAPDYPVSHCSNILCATAGDLRGDGESEFVVGTFDGVTVYDQTGHITWQFQTGTGKPPWAAVCSVWAGNLRGQGQTDVVAFYEGGIVALDGTGNPLWHFASPDISPRFTWGKTHALCVTDLDGDGKLEVLALGIRGLVALDTDGHELWRASVSGTCLAAADLNGDGCQEVVVAGEQITVLGPTGKLMCRQPALSPVESVVAGDLKGDGNAEIVLGQNGVTVLRLE
jgi:hypothetical protein